MGTFEKILVALVCIVVVWALFNMFSSSAGPADVFIKAAQLFGAKSGSNVMEGVDCKRLCVKPEDAECTKARDTNGKSCADILGIVRDASPPERVGRAPIDNPDIAAFSGAFIPGGTVSIALPESVKKEYAPVAGAQTFVLAIFDESNNNAVFQCSNPKADDAFLAPFKLKGVSEITCTFPTKDKISKENIKLTLPSNRSAYNIEQAIVEGKPYTIRLFMITKKDQVNEVFMPDLWSVPSGSGVFITGVAGKYVRSLGYESLSWACPSAQVYTSTNYEPAKEVVFNLSTGENYGWVLHGAYSTTANEYVSKAKIEIGSAKRSAPLADCTDLKDIATAAKTCQVAPKVNAGSTVKGKEYVDYKFTMPHFVRAEGVEFVVSYPVYAKNTDGSEITIKYPSDTKANTGPMCRTGTKIGWSCPTSDCYKNDKGKEYVISKYDTSGKYVKTPSCKYSEIGTEECAAGCKYITVFDAEGNPIKSAECILPRPGIVKAFMRVGTTASELEFDLTTGRYLNSSKGADKKIIFFDGSYDHTKKAVVIVVQNTAPFVKDGKLGVAADKIDVNATFEGVNLQVSPVPLKYYQYSDDTKIWDSKPIPNDIKTLSVGPQDILEYEATILTTSGEIIRDSDKRGPHTGMVGLNIDPSVKIANDSATLAQSLYSYTVFSSCCGTCSASCEDWVCTGKAKDGLCENFCKWVPIAGSKGYCAKN